VTNRPRARDLGIRIGTFEPGNYNSITDVAGVRVGHVTLISGEGPLRVGHGPVRTGVTAVLPPGDDWYHDPVEAASWTFNGAGTTAGLTLIDEFGRIETPILLTNTLSVGSVYEGVVRYMVDTIFAPRGAVPWFSPVVGETSDAWLNDIGGLHVRPEHAMDAIRNATGGPVPEGCVGAGTGMGALGFKAGIGTSSRRLTGDHEDATVGVLVQSNFGGRLTVAGVDLADAFGDAPLVAVDPLDLDGSLLSDDDGASIMIIIATDLPLSSRLLHRVCRRAVFGLARAGSDGGHGSGDYVIAFSTTHRHQNAMPRWRHVLATDEGFITRAFVAVAEATEEAILNSLTAATTMVGRDGHERRAVPIERIVEVLGKGTLGP